jgi:RHH-type transcriptional regulator, rel operon repressor / antitoxin RelB
MSTLVAVRLPDDLENKLEHLSQETGRSKSFYMKKALEQFMEDREDYLLAVARLEENNPRIPYEKIRKELGLED